MDNKGFLIILIFVLLMIAASSIDNVKLSRIFMYFCFFAATIVLLLMLWM